MSLANFKQIENVLVCPRCRLRFADTSRCQDKDHCPFAPLIFSLDQPILIDKDRTLFEPDEIEQRAGQSVISRPGHLRRRLSKLLLGGNRVTAGNIANILARHKHANQVRILVVGGGNEGEGLSALYLDPRMLVVSFDIYASPSTTFVADAHSIPVDNDYFDLVIVQAVLEHVLDPTQVVKEIHRVLKPGGNVYAETPFMQQVHEGAFDFQRFTLNGHRRLFMNFREIDSGIVSGSGTVLLWSLRYFFRDLFRSDFIAVLLLVPFCWLRFFDSRKRDRYTVDSAGGFYFIGCKDETWLAARDWKLAYP